MVYAKFNPTVTNVTTKAVTQWDYGRKLRIDGLELPTAVRIDFGVVGDQSTVSRIGTTKDHVTDVVIPDSLLEQSSNLVAYVYVNDTTEGKTVRTINIPVTARAKPEEFDTPESKALFTEAIELINDVAVRAEACADSARASLEATERIAEVFPATAENAVKTVNQTGADCVAAVEAEGASQLQQIQVAGENIVNAANNAEQNAKNVLASAIKGHLTGEVVTADDVSPVEHEMVVNVHGKNLFNVLAIPLSGPYPDLAYISSVSEGVVTVYSTEADGGYCRSGKTLRQVCGNLVIGEVYTLTANSQSASRDYIFLSGAEVSWKFGTSLQMTEKLLDSVVVFYGLNNNEGNGECAISNIQVELGTATQYEPYIDPTTVTVMSGGKTYKPDSNGTVSGMVSTAPNMTILTDTEGVVIDCEYIVDTKTYIDKLLK